ncbi:AraC family transcriptional regulator [Pedobacter aquatilis]|uniref:AraC family transcriptional regulator n=1 Tax=Pedobacter aquatilis TaxID=351343 RepID=UPI00292E49AA|nr:AraC family transcriptional regulator [Pedobacter aquatilis]
MDLDRKVFPYHYTLEPNWQVQFANILGAKLIDNKIIELPEKLGKGSSIFLQVMPGLSVFLLDMTFKIPVSIVRTPTDQQIYMAYFDMGDEITTHLLDGTIHRVGYNAKLGLAFMDSTVKGVIMPPVNERCYSLRLIIDKKIIREFLYQKKGMEISDKLLDHSCNTLFFYSHIDSRSKHLLNNLKNISFNEPSFQLKLKSTALFIFSYLLERASEFKTTYNKLSETDINNITKTSDYLLDNLLKEFPGLDFLAAMAEMSVSKYKTLFKKILKDSPNKFFLSEKLHLSQVLLKNGTYKNITDLAYYLAYTKPSYFSEVYKQKFGVLPSKDLVKQST